MDAVKLELLLGVEWWFTVDFFDHADYADTAPTMR
jgi:hypothetical protein